MPVKPEYHDHEEFINRSRKLEELMLLGIEPYPHEYRVSDHAALLHQTFKGESIGTSDDAASGTTPLVRIAGRLVLFRAMGKNAFGQIQDASGRIQVMFNREATELEGFSPNTHATELPNSLKVIEKKIDLGDILGLEGHLFRTHKQELTLFVKKATLLCKTLLPLPDKHSGLVDKELRYRKRWLDLISSEATCQTFKNRSKILQWIRNYFQEQGFMEVETPILQSIYGGAEARPFITTLHALDQEMFLRISLEIPLKKLIIGGMEKVFEIGKVFRNEGIDRNHNPEFTLLEAYAAYSDYKDMMRLLETLCEALTFALYGSTELASLHPETKEPILLQMKAPWPRYTMKESLLRFANLDLELFDDEAIRALLRTYGYGPAEKLQAMARGLLIATLFSFAVEPHLLQPHHIIDHPLETTPLCKPHREPKSCKEGLVERFESFILGQEIANSYTELNHPTLQRKLLEIQAARRDSGDEEAAPLDEEFIEAICQGMPPTAGIGIGIDRLIMLLTQSPSIRDVLYFPWMKPLSEI